MLAIVFSLLVTPMVTLMAFGQSDQDTYVNPIYNFPRLQITDSKDPKFFLDMQLFKPQGSDSDYAVFSYLTPTNQSIVNDIAREQYKETFLDSASVVSTIEEVTEFGMYTYKTNFSIHIALAPNIVQAKETTPTLVDVVVANDVLGFRYPIKVDPNGEYLHIAYVVPVYGNRSEVFKPFIDERPANRLVYERFKISDLLNGVSTPDITINMTSPQREFVVSTSITINPNNGTVQLVWSSYMEAQNVIVSQDAIKADPTFAFDRKIYVNSYAPLTTSYLESYTPGDYPDRYLFGQNRTEVLPYAFRQRSTYQAMSYVDDEGFTHLIWSWRSIAGVINKIYHTVLPREIPYADANFTFSLGGEWEQPGKVNDARAILRRINVFPWQGRDYIAFTPYSVSLPYYAQLDNPRPFEVEFPGDLKKNQLSLDAGVSSKESWVVWSILVTPSEETQPWFYMVMIDIFGDSGFVQSRVTLTSEVAHLYPNAEFTDNDELVLAWIDAKNQGTPQNPNLEYELVLAFPPDIPQARADPVLLLVIGFLFMGGVFTGVTILVLKTIPREEEEINIPIPGE